jgi:hypothetical protein
MKKVQRHSEGLVEASPIFCARPRPLSFHEECRASDVLAESSPPSESETGSGMLNCGPLRGTNGATETAPFGGAGDGVVEAGSTAANSARTSTLLFACAAAPCALTLAALGGQIGVPGNAALASLNLGILVFITAFTLECCRRAVLRSRTGSSLCCRTFLGSLGTRPMECGCRKEAAPKLAVGALRLPEPSVIVAGLVIDSAALCRASRR